MIGISIMTVVLSAGVSVFTGYVGVLLNYSRQRQRQRRIYGLSLLAEVKALPNLARQYYGSFSINAEEFEQLKVPKIRFSAADASVFNNVSANVGLFSAETAVATIEYDRSVRNLAAQAQAPGELQNLGAVGVTAMRDQVADHRRFLRIARRHEALVVRTLRRETPIDLSEKLRFCRRRTRAHLRRLANGPWTRRQDVRSTRRGMSPWAEPPRSASCTLGFIVAIGRHACCDGGSTRTACGSGHSTRRNHASPLLASNLPAFKIVPKDRAKRTERALNQTELTRLDR